MMRSPVMPFTALAIALVLASCDGDTERAGAGPSMVGSDRDAVFTEDFESGTLAAWPVSYTHLTLPTILRV